MPAKHEAPVLSDLLQGVLMPAQLKQQPVQGLQLDSRKVVEGEVFLAVPGLSVDGRDYIEQALAAGAVAVFAEAEGLRTIDPRVISVANLNRQISEIAGRFYGNPSAELRVTGITGTNGKTTCSHLLGQLLSRLSGSTAVIGTLGYGVYDLGAGEMQPLGMTTPDAVSTQSLMAAALQQDAVSVAMEVSSHSLDQSRVAAVHFDTAVFTNLSRDHLDYHGDMESYAQAKFSLFQYPGLQRAVVNADDPAVASLLAQFPEGLNCIRYGFGDSAEVRASKVTLGKAGFSVDIDTPWGNGHFYAPLLGEFNISNLLAVIGVAGLQGYPLADILEQVPSLQPVAGRMELVSGSAVDAPAVIVDYAHTPDALEQALTTLRHHCSGRLWVVFGCGGDRDKGKRPEMGQVASTLADEVLITSDNPRSEKPLDIMLDIAASVSEARMLEQRDEAIRTAISEAEPEDVILIAGKGHENYQQIGEQKLPFSDLDVVRQVLVENWGGEQ